MSNFEIRRADKHTACQIPSNSPQSLVIVPLDTGLQSRSPVGNHAIVSLGGARLLNDFGAN